jgi:hypothetical protein
MLDILRFLRHWLWIGFQVWFIACVVIPYAIWGVFAIIESIRDKGGEQGDD